MQSGGKDDICHLFLKLSLLLRRTIQMALAATMQKGLLPIGIYDSEQSMGEAAARDAEELIQSVLIEKGEVNIIFAAARSQVAFLDALTAKQGIDWTRINAFHMDEYAGLSSSDKKSLAWWLQSRYFAGINFQNVYFIDGRAGDAAAECERYAELLGKHPADIIFLGIGDNGHLAFNDPHVANFNDSQDVKQVFIDDVSKQQQVNAGNFNSIADVPSLAYTLTIPVLMRANSIICVVPTGDKARAVACAVNGDLNESCPASILRQHRNAVLYLDQDSASGSGYQSTNVP